MPRLALLCFLFAGGLFLAARPVQAQNTDREATEQRLEALKQQIEEDERRLAEKEQEEQASLETLEDLDRQIALRRELVSNYQRRLEQLNREEDSLRTSLRTLEQQLGQLREGYQERATHAYKYGRLHDVALILAAESINQMLVRVRYLHRFTQERRRRLEELRAASETIEVQRDELAAKRQETVELLREAERERQNLTRLQNSRRQVVQELRAQSASIKEEIEQKRSAAQELENRIRQLVAAERRRQRDREAASPGERARFEALTGSFQQNQGNLPWPVDGAVTESFGTLRNPVHGTETPNPGILIATSPQAEVRAVFEGEVINIDAMPDYGTLVTIRHGDYLTLYSNLSMLYIGTGDRIEAGQTIGRAGTEAEPRGAALFFALFNGSEAVDPAGWLRGQ